MARLFYAKWYYAAGTLCFGCIMFFVVEDGTGMVNPFVLLYFCSINLSSSGSLVYPRILVVLLYFSSINFSCSLVLWSIQKLCMFFVLSLHPSLLFFGALVYPMILFIHLVFCLIKHLFYSFMAWPNICTMVLWSDPLFVLLFLQYHCSLVLWSVQSFVVLLNRMSVLDPKGIYWGNRSSIRRRNSDSVINITMLNVILNYCT